MIAPQVHVPYHRIGEFLPFLRKHRINLELYFSARALDAVKYSDIRELKNILDYNPSLTFHSPFMDLSPGAEDLKVRAITLERFSHVFDIAAILNPGVITFHSGYEKWKYALKIETWLENSIQIWRELVQRATEMGIKIAVENIFEDNPENLRLLIEALPSEHFGLCFDTGHFNLFSTISLAEWLDQVRPHIFEIHLHDNTGNADDHLAIGDGNFDFAALFAGLCGITPVYTIEAHSKEDVFRSIEQLNKYCLPLSLQK
jgi:sugar phosphate isomerase/epimerase